MAQVVDFKNPPKAPMRAGADPVVGDVSGPGVIRTDVKEKTGDAPLVDPAAEAHKAALPAVPAKLPEEKHPAEMPAAMKLFYAGNYAAAQKMFEKFINTGIADEETHYNLGLCLYYQRRYTASLKEFGWMSKNAKHNFSLKFKAEKTSGAIRTLMSGICPGNCLKPNDPHWSYDPSVGPGKYYKFTTKNGWKGFSEGHMGDVIVFKDGEPFDAGPCPTCGGRGTIPQLHDGDPLPNQ